jgi:hypothetical protein
MVEGVMIFLGVYAFMVKVLNKTREFDARCGN